MAKRVITKRRGVSERPEHPLHIPNYPTQEQVDYDTRPGKDSPNTGKDVNLPNEKAKSKVGWFVKEHPVYLPNEEKKKKKSPGRGFGSRVVRED